MCLQTELDLRPSIVELLHVPVVAEKLEEFGLGPSLDEAMKHGKSLIPRKGSAGRIRNQPKPPLVDPNIVYSVDYRRELRQAALAERQADYAKRDSLGKAALKAKEETYRRVARVGSAKTRSSEVVSSSTARGQEQGGSKRSPEVSGHREVDAEEQVHKHSEGTSAQFDLEHGEKRGVSPWAEESVANARGKEVERGTTFSQRRREDPRFLVGNTVAREPDIDFNGGLSSRKIIASSEPLSARVECSQTPPGMKAISNERSRLRCLAIDADRRRAQAEQTKAEAEQALRSLQRREGDAEAARLTVEVLNELENARTELRRAEHECAAAWEEVTAVESRFELEKKGNKDRKSSLDASIANAPPPPSESYQEARPRVKKGSPFSNGQNGNSSKPDMERAEWETLKAEYREQYLDMKERMKAKDREPMSYASEGDLQSLLEKEKCQNTGKPLQNAENSRKDRAKSAMDKSTSDKTKVKRDRHQSALARETVKSSKEKQAPVRKITLAEALQRQKASGFTHFDANGKPLTYVGSGGAPGFGSFAAHRPLRAVKPSQLRK
mmetsp:Transcript_2499/g.5227  ORF Transcript_2499/g.5227 Transcript_2499/m.5227 type:complete len:555 (-) Transcript_2499:128-1792(-)